MDSVALLFSSCLGDGASSCMSVMMIIVKNFCVEIFVQKNILF